MARAHFVKKAQKDHPEGGIKKGESYYWWAFMVGGRGGPKHYSKTQPKASQLTQSEFLGAMSDIEDEIGALSADDSLESSVTEIAERIRELGSEQEGKKDNLPEGLQDGPTGELLQQRSDRCGEIADELEGIEFNGPENEGGPVAAEGDKKEGENEGEQEDADDTEDADDYWQGKLDEVQAVDLTVD